MPTYPHHTHYETLSDAVLAFGHWAREHGLNVGIQENLEALSILQLDDIHHHINSFRYGLQAIFCCSEEEGEVFNRLFDFFWKGEKGELRSKTKYSNQSNLQKKAAASIVLMGKGSAKSAEEEDSKSVSGANETTRLRQTDFSKIEAIDSVYLEELALELWQQMSLRLKRKLKNATTKGRINLRKTIRQNIMHGGDPIQLYRRQRKAQKQRLVILLDVSGSMDKYSFFLLRFICALRVHFESIEAFIFSTKLICITPFLQTNNLRETLFLLSAQANNWSSGTAIGACLKTFNEQYAKKVLNGRSTTIILSDGLDTGEPDVLEEAMQHIKRRTRQLIWLNPLKGMMGYEPIQRGMSAALPSLDIFESAHNLDAILELEKFLFDV